MPGDNVIKVYCGQTKTAPNGETHQCYESLNHDGNHICCEDGGIWNQNGQWVVVDDVDIDMPSPDGEFSIGDLIFETNSVVSPEESFGLVATNKDDSWEEGLY